LAALLGVVLLFAFHGAEAVISTGLPLLESIKGNTTEASIGKPMG
jgi:hypothetical protein